MILTHWGNPSVIRPSSPGHEYPEGRDRVCRNLEKTLLNFTSGKLKCRSEVRSGHCILFQDRLGNSGSISSISNLPVSAKSQLGL